MCSSTGIWMRDHGKHYTTDHRASIFFFIPTCFFMLLGKTHGPTWAKHMPYHSVTLWLLASCLRPFPSLLPHPGVMHVAVGITRTVTRLASMSQKAHQGMGIQRQS